MDITVYENALPSNLYEEIKDIITNPLLGWRVTKNTAQIDEPKEKYALNSYGFAMYPLESVFDDKGYPTANYNTPNSDFFNIFLPVYLCQLDKLGLKSSDYELIRMRVGLQTNQGKKIIHDPHVDYSSEHRTMLTYFTTEEGSGETLFYKGNSPDNLEVYLANSPKENTMVDFDGSIYHSSSAPIKNVFRYALNINYRKKSAKFIKKG